MPPPSSPAERQQPVWNLRRSSNSSATTSESENQEDSGGEREGTRLNTLNLLSSFFLRSRNSDSSEWRGWNNRYSSVNDGYLHINEIPIEIRNIDFENEDRDYRSGSVLSDQESNDETYHEDLDDETDSASDDDDSISHVQMNERLLLSSARQNLTNTNTLISFDDNQNDESNEPPQDAIPLRRSNAVRWRGRPLSSEKDIKNKQKLLKKEARSIYRDIHMIVENIKALKNYKGESPIFCNHTPNHKHFSNQENENKESLFLNLDTIMDSFLEKCKTGELWSVDYDKHVDENPSSGRRGKRRRSQDIGSERKRHKSSQTDSKVHSSSTYSTHPTRGDRIGVSVLSKDQKRRIMNITRSSFLKDGSTFCMKFDEYNSFDLNFSSVDYEHKVINGAFCVEPDVFDKEGVRHFVSRVSRLKNFLIGYNQSKNSLPKENSIAKKIRLVSRLEGDMRVHLSKDQISPLKVSPFLVPFSGKMVDFEDNDLRFLNSIDMPLNMRVRSLQIARTKSFRVRSQLAEWMKINPFKQFEETYFLKKLSFLDKRLRNCTKARTVSTLEEDHLETGRGLKANVYELTRDFDLIRYKDSPVPFLENKDTRREPSLKDIRPNLFLQNWQRSLCDKLTEFVTCKGHCLLNIQLNYILFKLDIDLSEFLDSYVEFLLQICPAKLANKYKSAFKGIRQSESNSKPQNNVLVGSLNRKTGCIELQNTVAYLDFKNVYQAGTSSFNNSQSDANSFTILNEQGENIDLVSLLSSDESEGDNFLQGRDRYKEESREDYSTTVKGNLKRSYSIHSMGGGNPSYIHL